MEIVLVLMVVFAFGLVAWLGFAQSGEPPARGKGAPAFDLEGADGSPQTLASVKGSRAAIVFHPQDDTPECVAVVERLAALAPAAATAGAALITVVVSEPAAARAYAQKHGAGLRVACDPTGRTAKAYGALVNLGFMKFARKLVVLVDANGRVERTWRDPVGPAHVDEVGKALGLPPG
jgi:peroxiredoxin Q/BCP